MGITLFICDSVRQGADKTLPYTKAADEATVVPPPSAWTGKTSHSTKGLTRLFIVSPLRWLTRLVHPSRKSGRRAGDADKTSPSSTWLKRLLVHTLVPLLDGCLGHTAFRFHFIIHIVIHDKVYMDGIVWQAQEVIHWSAIFLCEI